MSKKQRKIIKTKQNYMKIANKHLKNLAYLYADFLLLDKMPKC